MELLPYLPRALREAVPEFGQVLSQNGNADMVEEEEGRGKLAFGGRGRVYRCAVA